MLAVFAAIFASGSPSHARSLDVELFGGSISPPVLIAQPGDRIQITAFEGVHQLVSYASNGGTSFDTGVLRGSKFEPATSAFEFFGATVRYRCTRHSTFSEVNGLCDGLCAVVTEEDSVPVPPVIDPPTRTIEERPATISGTAEPMTVVELREGFTYDTGAYKGQGLTATSGVWSVKTVDFGRTGSGSKRLWARTVRGNGYVSTDSASETYFYNADASPPIIAWDPIAAPFALGSQTLTGTARDNIGIRGLAITLTRVDVNPNAATRTTRTFRVAAKCTPACPVRAPNTTIAWEFDPATIPDDLLPTGVYTVTATAIDTSDGVASMAIPTLGNLYLRNGCVTVSPPDNSPPKTICVGPQATPPVLPSPYDSLVPSPLPTP